MDWNFCHEDHIISIKKSRSWMLQDTWSSNKLINPLETEKKVVVLIDFLKTFQNAIVWISYYHLNHTRIIYLKCWCDMLGIMNDWKPLGEAEVGGCHSLPYSVFDNVDKKRKEALYQCKVVLLDLLFFFGDFLLDLFVCKLGSPPFYN